MFNLPNFLSLLRAPLALVFLQEDPIYRAFAVVVSMLTDGLDGYLARRYNMSSRLGTVLDPLMDKFFVFFVLGVLIQENRLSFWEAGALMCRDFSVILFGFYLACRGQLITYQFRALWCGKATTFLQFIVLLGVISNVAFPSYLFVSFIVLGIFALFELYLVDHSSRAVLN